MSQHEVGYGRPPKQHQFEKGRSGNPKGRPKKPAAHHVSLAMPQDLRDLVLKEAERTVRIVENGREVEVSILEAILRRQSLSAAKGDLRASTAFLRLVEGALESAKTGGRSCNQTISDMTKMSAHEAAAAYAKLIRGE